MENTLTLLKHIEKEVKYSVIITDTIMTIYVLWLIITNTSHWIPGVLFGITPYGVILLLRANKLFHLCKIHKMMLIHSFIIYLCCVYQAYFGFGNTLYLIRCIMFISGLVLIVQLIIQQICRRINGHLKS